MRNKIVTMKGKKMASKYVKLDKVINEFYEYAFDAMTAVYQCVKENHLNADGIKYVFEHINFEGKVVDKEDENAVDLFVEHIEKYEKMIHGIIVRLVKENDSEKEFYQKLWDLIESDGLIDSGESEKIYAWIFVWKDKLIPYYKTEGTVKMSNDQFQDYIEKLDSKINKIRFLLNIDFVQKTERSSSIMKVIESCNTIEEKSVLLAILLDLSKPKISWDEDLLKLKALLQKNQDDIE